jgi:hypothetical protein
MGYILTIAVCFIFFGGLYSSLDIGTKLFLFGMFFIIIYILENNGKKIK